MSSSDFLERHYRLLLAGIGMIGIAMTVALRWGRILAFRFFDPDDLMRLMEVRDWLRGQSWFDVTQYRLNPPDGFAMHWSRLVDMPLAATIALLQPWFGQRVAETAASVVVPMATLALAMLIIAELARRICGTGAALLAALFCFVSIGTFYALVPMRIDHHGWEAVAGLAMVLALTSAHRRRGAILAGLSAALWMHISLEGIAFTAAASAWLGLRWILSPEREGPRLPLFLGALAVLSSVLFFISHGIALAGQTSCDAVSPLHIVIFAEACLLTGIAHRAGLGFRLARGTALAVAGAACALTYALWAPQCLGGPFSMLDPLAFNLWYLNVHEGRPVWESGGRETLLWTLVPAIGLLGAFLMARRATPKLSEHIIDYCGYLALASAIGVLVLRAGGFANLLAIPGEAAFVAILLKRFSHWPALVRVGARVFSLILLCPLSLILLVGTLPARAAGPVKTADDAKCHSIDNYAHLDRLPPSLMVLPLDDAPMLIASTHHTAIASGYHRNVAAMDEVLRFFISDERSARAIAQRHKARYVAFCPLEHDIQLMAKLYPRGLAADLLKGHEPAWLKAFRIPGTGKLILYSVQ